MSPWSFLRAAPVSCEGSRRNIVDRRRDGKYRIYAVRKRRRTDSNESRYFAFASHRLENGGMPWIPETNVRLARTIVQIIGYPEYCVLKFAAGQSEQ